MTKAIIVINFPGATEMAMHGMFKSMEQCNAFIRWWLAMSENLPLTTPFARCFGVDI